MKKFSMNQILLYLISCFFLTGCWDKVELENRGFVNAIGIDKFYEDKKTISFEKSSDGTTNRFVVSMSLPSLDSLSGKGSEEAKNKSVKLAANETVSAAMRLVDSSSSQKIYFGHTKVTILGKEMLEDESLFRETIDALERNREISRKIIVVATEDKASSILEEDITGEPLVGMFISNFYKNNESSLALAYRQDLESLIRDLRSTGCTIIPKIDIKDKEVKLGGSAIIKDFKLVGWLDDQETRGYLWLKGEAKGAQITIPYENFYIPLRVNKASSKLDFFENGESIVCTGKIKVEGSIEEFTFSNETLYDSKKIDALCREYEEAIKKEILNTNDFFQKQFKVDGFGFMDRIRKTNYEIFNKYRDNWNEGFQKIVLVPEVQVEITSTGSTK